MPDQQANSDFNPLGRLAGIVGLLAVALYFTGWVYRWTYFGAFKIQVASLNLPIESFYLAAFRALFGGPWIILRTVLALFIVVTAILFTLQGIQSIKDLMATLLKIVPSRLALGSYQVRSLLFLISLVNELVIVLYFLTTLYFLAQWQADLDYWNDVVNGTTELPRVTALIREDNAALGNKLLDPASAPVNFRIIGDQQIYEQLLAGDINDTESEEERVWRLLIDRDGYFYIFPALPEKDRKRNVPVVIIYESGNGDQITILSPGHE